MAKKKIQTKGRAKETTSGGKVSDMYKSDPRMYSWGWCNNVEHDKHNKGKKGTSRRIQREHELITEHRNKSISNTPARWVGGRQRRERTVGSWCQIQTHSGRTSTESNTWVCTTGFGCTQEKDTIWVLEWLPAPERAGQPACAVISYKGCRPVLVDESNTIGSDKKGCQRGNVHNDPFSGDNKPTNSWTWGHSERKAVAFGSWRAASASCHWGMDKDLVQVIWWADEIMAKPGIRR